jgi:hypothetical protein
MLTCCFIRDDPVPWRRKRNACPGPCVYNILQGAKRSQVFISWVRFAGTCFLRSSSLSVNSIFVHTVLHSPTPSHISSIKNKYLSSLYTKHNLRNCNVVTSCFIFSVISSCYFCYLKLCSVERSTVSCQLSLYNSRSTSRHSANDFTTLV